jgi:hypothetical protein
MRLRRELPGSLRCRSQRDLWASHPLLQAGNIVLDFVCSITLQVIAGISALLDIGSVVDG